MNCFAIARYSTLLSLACLVALLALADRASAQDDSLVYDVHYELEPAGDNQIDVSMTVRQPRDLLREVRFGRGADISNVRVDGEPLERGDPVVWQPGPRGGTISWSVALSSERNGNGHDAWLEEDWGIFRAEDVIPRAATRSIRGARSNTSMAFDLPADWTLVTPYAADDDGQFRIDKPYRNFDQPDGWIAAGKLGIRRDIIAGMRVAVAGPTGQSVGRMEVLAMLNWTMPELERALGELPERLTIVRAGAPMWRGGLSGPNSLFLHADRPMISENSTSPLLHEVMHSILRISAADGYDWIVEGLAEYYSLELLRRSDTITPARYDKAMQSQQNWAKSANRLCRRASTGATTALAVTVMAALDKELRNQSGGTASLDDVLVALRADPLGITLADLQTIVGSLLGDDSVTLQLDKLPGCRSIAGNAGQTS